MSSYLKNVAIVGASGQVGSPIVNALLEQGMHNVTAITRPDSTSSMPSGLAAVKKAEYDDHAALVEALRGQDVLVISMNVMAPAGSQEKIIDAAADAGVKFVIPSEWGNPDDSHPQMGKDVFLGPVKQAIRDHIDTKSSLKRIGVACGFWYDYSLAGTAARFGFDFPSRTVTFFDDGKTKITTSTWQQVGRTVAKLLALPEHGNSNGPSLSDWAGRSVVCGSFYVSQRDMLDSVLRVTGDKESDWTINYEKAEERYQRGLEMKKGGDRTGFAMLLYTRCFFSNDPANFQGELDNKVLGLPQEDFDAATKSGVDMAAKQ